jgi:photosystem II stability/assembly factor-like uncharacterized protein
MRLLWIDAFLTETLMSYSTDHPTRLWQQSTLKGGGFIVGILQDRVDPSILYARADVAGVFKSMDGGKTWSAKNHGMRECHQHDVRSFTLSPHDSRVLFRGSGSVRGGKCFGTIHKSIDGGEFWFPVCSAVDFYGNGETRQYGEVIQIDPHRANVVIAGGYSAGVWLSKDSGDQWNYIGLKDERIACVAFHPNRLGEIYVGTIGRQFESDPLFTAQQYDYLRPNPPRLYRSVDDGNTWEILLEGADIGEIAFDPTASDTLHDTLYIAALRDGVLKSADGGRTWKSTRLGKYPIGTLTVDPHDAAHVYAAAETFPNFDPEVPPIGIYHSTDSGESWQLLHWHTESDIRNYPSYMTLPYAGWAISKIRVDVRDKHRLYISNWYGVSTSDDGGRTLDANYFAGMENVCIENMVVHPTRPNTVFMVMADHAPKVSTDGGCTFAAMPRPRTDKPQPDSTALVASRFRPELVLYGMKGSGGCSIIRARIDDSDVQSDTQIVMQAFAPPDSDESRLAFQSRAAGVSVQALAEDPFTPGVFYAYLDGILAAGAGIYRTADYGDNWQRLSNPFPDHISRVPHQREWIENELLSVVVAQTKNVCGTNGLLCIDPHVRDVLYVGEWTEGLYRSTDGGATWRSIGDSLPFRRDRASVLNVIRADENQRGVLYAGFIREGLWRSRDHGDTWEKLTPDSANDTIFNATSVAVGGADGRLIVVVSEPLYWSPCSSAVMVSRDAGATWENVYDPRLGAIRWKTVTLEPHSNTAYLGSCGNSAFILTLA